MEKFFILFFLDKPSIWYTLVYLEGMQASFKASFQAIRRDKHDK